MSCRRVILPVTLAVYLSACVEMVTMNEVMDAGPCLDPYCQPLDSGPPLPLDAGPPIVRLDANPGTDGGHVQDDAELDAGFELDVDIEGDAVLHAL